jgi:hypothetical protein
MPLCMPHILSLLLPNASLHYKAIILTWSTLEDIFNQCFLCGVLCQSEGKLRRAMAHLHLLWHTHCKSPFFVPVPLIMAYRLQSPVFLPPLPLPTMAYTQCKAPFSYLYLHRQLDGTLSDYPVEEVSHTSLLAFMACVYRTLFVSATRSCLRKGIGHHCCARVKGLWRPHVRACVRASWMPHLCACMSHTHVLAFIARGCHTVVLAFMACACHTFVLAFMACACHTFVLAWTTLVCAPMAPYNQVSSKPLL